MSVVYTVGDFAVTQLGPTLLWSPLSESGRSSASTTTKWQSQGHEMARAHGVSLWRIDAGHPRAARLIISYRVSGLG
jgi:hypothetical protein